MRKRTSRPRALRAIAARWVDVEAASAKLARWEGLTLLLGVHELAAVLVATIWPIFAPLEEAKTTRH